MGLPNMMYNKGNPEIIFNYYTVVHMEHTGFLSVIHFALMKEVEQIEIL